MQQKYGIKLHDMQAVVEAGCPNLLRKAVNSAKRLRAHVQLDEGDVWSACNLRNSCDRACNFSNFSRNIRCLKCKTERPPKRVNTDEVERKKGDWTCPQCGFMNYASNVKCLRCPEPRPKKHPGDWSCFKCGFMNFARKVKCLRCLEPNPSSKKYPGDWSCPKCDFYNYARNMSCLKCNTDRPKEQPASEHEEHIWRGSN